uniref:Uncharacterized protein n=1 Tax=Arundo donax TaxID=35708 RepID=A0A0A9AFY3_ARUDO
MRAVVGRFFSQGRVREGPSVAGGAALFPASSDCPRGRSGAPAAGFAAP